jgi:glutamine synthetase
MSSHRFSAILNVAGTTLSKKTHQAQKLVKDLFAVDVFNTEVMRTRLRKPVFNHIQDVIHNNHKINNEVADEVAGSLKSWAESRGATHYTHWFLPLSAVPACKMTSFLQYDHGNVLPGENHVMEHFSGAELTQAEVDGSSFPNGGLRLTHEARGYALWDVSMPPFIRHSVNGSTLYIPAVFTTWHGTSLDRKLPMLRAEDALTTWGVKLLDLMSPMEGCLPTGKPKPTGIISYLGAEQEFFVMDRQQYLLRPDLVETGRTLVGQASAKGQEASDFYLAEMPDRVLAYLTEVEQVMWRLGVPMQARHSEVAPGQFELASIYERSLIGVGRDLLRMNVMHEVAREHSLAVSFHEKPFQGLNGSGKHNNWSIGTNTGLNLLQPSKEHGSNVRFLTFLSLIIRAVDVHQGLLRASVANAGNEYRLGAQEAPPAIISVFVGESLMRSLENLRNGKISPADLIQHFAKNELIDVSNSIPTYVAAKDDRNRTSPFAFTGNRFEFRAPGSSQACSEPITAINVAVCESIQQFVGELEEELAGKDKKDGKIIEAAVLKLCGQILQKHARIIFNGDGYSDAWVNEAEKRGLLNDVAPLDALKHYNAPRAVQAFEAVNVLTAKELDARAAVLSNEYATKVLVEARCMRSMIDEIIVPSAFRYQAELCAAIAAKQAATQVAPSQWQVRVLEDFSTALDAVLEGAAELKENLADTEANSHGHGDMDLTAPAFRELRPGCDALREKVDTLESMMADSHWSLPKTRELLHLK